MRNRDSYNAFKLLKWVGSFLAGFFQGGSSPGGNLMGGNYRGGSFPGVNFPRTVLSSLIFKNDKFRYLQSFYLIFVYNVISVRWNDTSEHLPLNE